MTDGEFVKKCCVDMDRALGNAKAVKEFEKVPLSAKTLTTRIKAISSHLSQKLQTITDDCAFFSLALDESTDVTDVAQLLFFIRTVSKNFVVHEELLSLESYIFHAFLNVLASVGGKEKLSVVTDGAPAMCGKKDRLAGKLKAAGIECPIFHCIIHQEALCGKLLNLSDTMSTVTKCVNFIRGGHNSSTHRQFVSFLTEVEANYNDLLLYAEVRWLSKGKCLQRFFALRKDVLNFLVNVTGKKKGAQAGVLCNKLRDIDFLRSLAFLTDITKHMNDLNFKLQGKNQTIAQLLGHVHAFKR